MNAADALPIDREGAQRMLDAMAALAPKRPTITVKPLVWESPTRHRGGCVVQRHDGPEDQTYGYTEWQTANRLIRVWHEDASARYQLLYGWWDPQANRAHPTLEAAQSAAQAEWEAFVCAAIVTS